MAAGDTTTGALADSLPTVVSAARIVREFVGVMPTVVDKETLGKGIGLSWNEVSMTQLTAQAVTENTRLDNPQQMSDTLFSIKPSVVGIETLITDRVANRISRKAFKKLGGLGMNAIQRKKDEDGITVLDGATTSLSGAGTTLAAGVIRAARYRISSNVTEPGLPPYVTVLHGFQIKDVEDEIVQGVNPSTNPEQLLSGGLSQQVYVNGFEGRLAGTMVHEDGNITIDSDADSKGGTFAKEGIVLVQGHSVRTELKRRPEVGGGANSMYIYDEYAYGERSAGNWLFEVYSDATAPTS